VADGKSRGQLDIVWPAYDIAREYRGFYRPDGVSDDPKDKQNRFASQYYGVNTIVLGRPE